MHLFEIILSESFDEYRGLRWIHYTDHPMMTVRMRTFHSDPAGLYFFPFHYDPEAAMWHKMGNRFVVELKPGARVLDLPAMDDSEIDALLGAVGLRDSFVAALERYPPATRDDHVRMMWGLIRNENFKFQGKWNKLLRSMGYDAVFDDRGIIHSGEPIQLLVLNPRAVTVISHDRPKRSYYAKMIRVYSELVALCTPYGKLDLTAPALAAARWSTGKNLLARVEVHRSEENYASFSITMDQRGEYSHLIRVSLEYAQPSLGYGSGATFNGATNRWEYRGLETVKGDLERIFGSEAATRRAA